MGSDGVLGIDLGTTNSVVAVAGEDGARVIRTEQGEALIPSVVSFHPSGEVLVGKAAKDRRLLDAENTIYSVKRLIGRPFSSEEVQQAKRRFAFEMHKGPSGGVLVSARGESYTLSEISAFVLRQVRHTAQNELGQGCERAVVTVPANFNELQRSATKAAGRVAGLDVLRILNEPTAAALAYGFGKTRTERVAVYDLGGGTFDITILQLAGDVFEVLATAGDTFLGGDDVDTAIADDMADKFLAEHRYDLREDTQAYERLRAAAEWAKCRLSAEKQAELSIEELAYGAGGASLDLDYAISREHLNKIAQPFLARTFDVCEEAMKTAGIRPTQLDNVVLVGGSTRIPLLQKLVAQYFGRAPLVNIDPDLVVARGAALQASALAGYHRKATLGRVALKKIPAADDDLGDQSTVIAERPRLKDVKRTQLGLGPAKPSGQYHLTVDDAEQEAFDSGGTNPRVAAMAPEIEEIDLELEELKTPPPKPPPVPPLAAAPVAPPEPRLPTPAPAAPSLGPPITMDGPDLSGQMALEEEETQMAPPPLLLDVTPLSLGVETVDGYCEHIIARNAAIPAEQTKMFTTANDFQQTVRVQICQGESRRLADNQPLGELVLDGLRSAARGEVQISVTFVIDVDGTLNVRAVDLGTGKEQQIAIKLIGGVSDEEIARLAERHEQKFGE